FRDGRGSGSSPARRRPSRSRSPRRSGHRPPDLRGSTSPSRWWRSRSRTAGPALRRVDPYGRGLSTVASSAIHSSDLTYLSYLSYLSYRIKKPLVYSRERGREIVRSQHERDVSPRCRLRDHANRHIAGRREQLSYDRWIVLQALADCAQDGHAILTRNVGDAAQRLHGVRHAPRVVDRDRNADLGCRHDVDGDAMLLEHFEDTPQKSVRHQHARRRDVDHGHAGLRRDRRERTRRRRPIARDERADRIFRTPRVENSHWDIARDGGLNRRGVQDLRAEVRELGRF